MAGHGDAPPPSPRGDLFIAGGFLLFGLAVVAASAAMPTFTDQGTPTYVAPGLVPAFHGVGIGLLSLTLVFAVGMIGRMPFWLAAAAFVFLFILVFELRRGVAFATLARDAAWAAAIALASGWSATLLFQNVFLIRMP